MEPISFADCSKAFTVNPPAIPPYDSGNDLLRVMLGEVNVEAIARSVTVIMTVNHIRKFFFMGVSSKNLKNIARVKLGRKIPTNHGIRALDRLRNNLAFLC